VVPTFELPEILAAADAVSTATINVNEAREACELATSLVEAEFRKVPATQYDEEGGAVDPPVGCLSDVFAQEGMCAMITQARPDCRAEL